MGLSALCFPAVNPNAGYERSVWPDDEETTTMVDLSDQVTGCLQLWQ